MANVKTLPDTAPVFLRAAVSLTANQTKSPDLTQLQNTFRQPMLIDEIRMLIRGVASTTQNISYPAALIRVGFTLGRMRITDNAMPAAAFQSPVENLKYDDTAVWTPTAMTGVGNSATGAAYNTVRWVLPKPLFIRPGDVLVPSLARVSPYSSVNGLDSTAINTYINYVGRTLPYGTKTPGKIPVPWVSGIVYDSASQIPKQTDFYNIFDVPLTVQRFFATYAQITLGGVNTLFGNTNTRLPGYSGNAAQPLLQIKDSMGYSITREKTSYGLIGDTNTSWIFNRKLLPGEAYFPAFFSIPTNTFPILSMIGWREERMAA